ncbi:ABC transporter ATP-binding protein [Sulfurivermis fontis]|uniref:ABC transporter ATP-binding protein n=1 Tax=Sulfurivermis fontis TaxID=1972068 RepID=UPI001558E271|nr:ABC transporter ATP-binding protein [Sulfurivermis fontis]
MSALIEVDNLVKHYQGVRAVDGISFTIPRGACFGLLGPNGAGKTTTVEMLEGIKPPTAGSIRYKGAPLGAQFRREAGIMFQSTALQEFITVRETLRMFRSLYDHGAALDELIDACALHAFLDRDTRKLSGGQRQRLLLAIALVNDPEVVFLDEPTTGLDPQARRLLWELVRAIKARGKTVLLTTHYMEEAYELCDEIIIMDHGRIIAQGSPDDLLTRHFRDVVLQLPKSDFNAGGVADLTVLDCGDSVEILTSAVTETVQRLLAGGVSLDRLRIRARTLDDLFLELTGKELRP